MFESTDEVGEFSKLTEKIVKSPSGAHFFNHLSLCDQRKMTGGWGGKPHTKFDVIK